MGTNGASKHQPAGLGQQRRGATVSFHNIDYKVTVGGNCLCRKKGTIKEILIDLKFEVFESSLKPTVTAFFTFVFSITMVTYTATAMVLAISADQTVVAIANIFMTIACVFMMIFAGLLVNLRSITSWLAWLKYFSIPRYGLAALQINEFTGLKFCGVINTTNIPPGIACTGEEFLDYQGVDWSTWGLWQNHVALGVMTFCFLTIAYLKLRFIRKFT
ncbi:hypothetical protein JOQ06_029207 [Pogonophryne albipinna]|nr:hypothetical protein JOQ06_029207 [Pogonophryne albipinna]